jgi:hypothetical protein
VTDPEMVDVVARFWNSGLLKMESTCQNRDFWDSNLGF